MFNYLCESTTVDLRGGTKHANIYIITKFMVKSNSVHERAKYFGLTYSVG